MTGVWAVLAGARWLSLAAVGAVGLGVVVWRLRAWWLAGEPEHDAWLDGIRMSDREVQELEAMARRVVREHEGRP